MNFLDTSAIYAIADRADHNHLLARKGLEAALEAGLHSWISLELSIRQDYSDFLRELLADARAPVRLGAASSLASDPAVQTDASLEPVIEVLEEGLRSADAIARLRSCEIASRLGPSAQRLLPAIIGLISDPDPEVRQAAIGAVERFGPAAASAVQDLIAKLRDPTAEVRVAAAPALGGIGPAAGSAAPALEKLLDSDDDPLRMAAEEALESIRKSTPAVSPAKGEKRE